MFRAGGLPIAKAFSSRGLGLLGGEVAADEERGGLGGENGSVEGADLIERDRRGGLAGAADGEGVGMGIAEKEPRADVVGDGLGIFEFLVEIVEVEAMDALEVFGGEAGAADGIGEEVHTLVEVALQHGHACGEGLDIRAGVEGCAEGLHGVGELRGVALARAFAEHFGGEIGEARVLVVSQCAAGVHDHRHGDEGEFGTLPEHDGDAAGEGEGFRGLRGEVALGHVGGAFGPGRGLVIALGLLGERAHDEARVLRDVLFRGFLNLRGGCVAVAVQIALEGVGLAEEVLVLVELVGLAGEIIQAGEHAKLDSGFALGEFIILHAGGQHLGDFLIHRLLDGVQVGIWLGEDGDFEKRSEGRGVLRGGDFVGDFVFEHEALVETAGLALREDRPEEIELGIAGLEGCGRVVDEGDLGKLDLVEHGDALHLAEDGGRPILGLAADDGWAFDDGREEPGDQGFDLGGLEITGDDERAVVRQVEVGEEVLDVVDGRGFQIGMQAVDVFAVWVADGVHVARDVFLARAIRRVLHVLADLVADDIALLVELLGRHGAAEVFHAIRIQPEQRGEQRARACGEVVGAVERGAGVCPHRRRLP